MEVSMLMMVVVAVLLAVLVLLLVAIILGLVVPLLALAVLVFSLVVIVVGLPLFVVLLVTMLTAVVLILLIVVPLFLIIRPLVARVLMTAVEVRISRHGRVILLILLMLPRALVVVVLFLVVSRVLMMLVALVAPIMLLIVLAAGTRIRIIWEISLVLRKVFRAEVRLSRIASLEILLKAELLVVVRHLATFRTFLEFFTVKLSSLILNLPLMLRFLVVVARVLNIFTLPVTILSIALTAPVRILLSLHLTVLMVVILSAVVTRSAVIAHLVGKLSTVRMTAVLMLITVLRSLRPAIKLLLSLPDLFYVLVGVIRHLKLE